VEEAEKHIRDGLVANKPWQNIMTEAFGLSALAHVLKAKRDYNGALQMIDEFEEKLRVHSRPREFDEDFYTLRARLLLASGDLQGASRWAEQAILSEDFRRHRELFRLTLAHIYLAQGRYNEIENILGGDDLQFAYGNRLARRLESNLLRAVVLAGQNHLAEANQLIDSCLELGEPEGYIRTFVDVGEPARNLLAAYLRFDEPGHERYARKVLEAFAATTDMHSVDLQMAGLIEPISEREMEVLSLMAQGRTNKEIANQLIVASGTIKAHAASIYRKLNVANRTEAVARARELGILS
jgi:LuxR family maltose regulon positive regulatory protein